MDNSKEAFWDILFFLLIIGVALLVDALLHWTGQRALGRYLGYLGTVFLLISFLHSARKRKWFETGRPPFFLRLHEILSWLGAMLILVHGGIHFNGLLPWLAMISMLVAVASGLTGKYLLRRSRALVEEKKKALLGQNLSPAELEERLYWDALVVEWMKKWRTVHIPITATFLLLASLHVVTILIFWRW